MSSARVQLFHGPGRPFESSTVRLPERLNPGEILVQITLATVCGSDLHTVSGRRSAPTPCVLGHEAIGRVVVSERAGFAEGQRVTWTLADSCGECPVCTQWGLPQKCTQLFKYGHAALVSGSGLNGCYATHIVLRAGTFVIPVPDGLSDALVAPANCALATIVNALEIEGLWDEAGGPTVMENRGADAEGGVPPHLTSPQGERDGRFAFGADEGEASPLAPGTGVAKPRSERAGVRGGSECGSDPTTTENRDAEAEGGVPPHLTSPQGERDGRLAFHVDGRKDVLPRPSGERAGVRGSFLAGGGYEKQSNRPRTALVQGGGLLGLYACAWLRFRGVERVFCTDLSPDRLALVPAFGGIAVPADAGMRKTILEESGGGVDLALEVAGTAAVIPDGIALLRPGGTYVWAGMVHPETALTLTGEAVLRKCLTIRGVHNYAPPHLATALDFLAAMQSRLPFEKLVSPALPLEALNEALTLSETRRWLRVSIAP